VEGVEDEVLLNPAPVLVGVTLRTENGTLCEHLRDIVCHLEDSFIQGGLAVRIEIWIKERGLGQGTLLKG